MEVNIGGQKKAAYNSTFAIGGFRALQIDLC